MENKHTFGELYRYPERSAWAAITARPHLDVSQLAATVNSVLADVKAHGDEAVKRYEEQFDHVRLDALDVTADESLAESAQILVKDIMSCAMADLQPETPIVPFYSPDVLINVTNTSTSGINNAAEGRYSDADAIYSINGVRTKSLQRGVNIVKKDGKTIKVVKK